MYPYFDVQGVSVENFLLTGKLLKKFSKRSVFHKIKINFNRVNFNVMSRKTVLAVCLVIAYLSVLWTVAYFDGSTGLWRFLNNTMRSIVLLGTIAHKCLQVLDLRIMNYWIPGFQTVLVQFQSTLGSGMTCGEKMATHTVTALLYSVGTVVENLFLFANRSLDTAEDLIHLSLVTFLKVFEPNESSKLTMAIAAFVLARLLDKVTECKEDLEFVVEVLVNFLQDIAMVFTICTARISYPAILYACAYLVTVIADPVRQALMLHNEPPHPIATGNISNPAITIYSLA